MTTIDPTTRTIEPPRDDFVIDDAHLAAVAFLARYSGRMLDACRHDLRGFFQWATDMQLTVNGLGGHPSAHRANPPDQIGGGSIRSTVLTRSIDWSNEATMPTPVVSAQATR